MRVKRAEVEEVPLLLKVRQRHQLEVPAVLVQAWHSSTSLAVWRIEGTSHALVTLADNCPLTAVMPRPPEVCELEESLLCQLTGLPMQEYCDRGEQPH